MGNIFYDMSSIKCNNFEKLSLAILNVMNINGDKKIVDYRYTCI